MNSSLQDLVSHIGSLNNSTNQPSSSSGLPSQPLPNPKDGINTITLRSETTLQERNQEEPSPPEHTPAEDTVEVEDAEEEEDIQDIDEEEETQPQSEAPRDVETADNARPIPFP
ncbi:uncharacterized protein LOC107469995 [Arachis duranensis]|uniref:Uncharacterized protein LOC107469995 n=1 Tax=Arachis duranensis TaxID=130453 RepID=A0A6P4BXF4_ARADU|nr:uncharacterized protein LOC107469995 [Arachis duranensis]